MREERDERKEWRLGSGKVEIGISGKGYNGEGRGG
jgi:hypothetical protein